MLKKFISILCAATMVASGAVVSVGASGNGQGGMDGVLNQEKPRISGEEKQEKNQNQNEIKVEQEKEQEKELNQRCENKFQELKDVQKKIGELFKLKKGDNFAKAQMKALGTCLKLHAELQKNFTVDVATKMIKEADKVINEVNERIDKNKAEQEKKEIKKERQEEEKEEERKAALKCYAMEEVEVDEEFIIETLKKKVDQTVEKQPKLEKQEKKEENEIIIEEKKEIRDINQKVEKLKEAEKELATQRRFKDIVDKKRGEKLSRLIGLCYKWAEKLKNEYVAEQAKDFFYWNEEALKLIDEFKDEFKKATQKRSPEKKKEILAKYKRALREIRESRANYNRARFGSGIRNWNRRVLQEKIYSYIKLVDQYGKLDEYTKNTYESLKIEHDKMVEKGNDYVINHILGEQIEEWKKAAMSPEQQKLYELDKEKQRKDFYVNLVNDLKEQINEKAKKLKKAQKEFVQFTNSKNLTSANNENVKRVFSLIDSCNELAEQLQNKYVAKQAKEFSVSAEEALEKIDKLKKEYAEKKVEK